MRFSRRALIFSAAGGFVLPLAPLLMFAHACSLDEFEPLPRSTSSASTSASTSSSGGGGGGGDSGAPPICPPEMAKINPGTLTSFCIDRYEVTRADYAAFLKVADGGTAPSDVCAWNKLDQPPASTPASLPVSFVDWCDAYAYCAFRGKRLCGSVDGGSVSFSSPDLRNLIGDQWQAACSNGYLHPYPYGDNFVLGRCADCNPEAGCAPDGIPEAGPDGDAPDLQNPAAAQVGAFSDCVTNGVYDLSGNVAEWEDSCLQKAVDDAGKRLPENDTCSVRGGSFKFPNTKNISSCLACAANCGSNKQPRNTKASDIGFRCCKDLE